MMIGYRSVFQKYRRHICLP